MDMVNVMNKQYNALQLLYNLNYTNLVNIISAPSLPMETILFCLYVNQ